MPVIVPAILLLVALAALAMLVLLIGLVAVPAIVIRRSQAQGAPAGMSEAQYAEDARRLVEEIRGALAGSAFSTAQRAELLRQLSRLPENVNRALHKLQRLRRVKRIAKRSEGAGAVLQDILQMEEQIIAELRSAHQTLLAMPVALMKLDLARGDRDFERMIASLDESNRRLHDLAESYEELRARQAWESLG